MQLRYTAAVSDDTNDGSETLGGKTSSEKEKEPAVPPQGKLGKFIQTYSSFLGSFVIGVAGLIATSIWQFRQSEIARHAAENQQKIAQMQAENSWRIERAEILGKNLSVLASHGPNTAEQRYGVLLSLTRGNILDPELAVSYALELGRDNTDYMKSVLSSTEHKTWAQLAHSFVLTCLQRYGAARDVPVCHNDSLEDRSQGIAELLSEEMGQGKTEPLDLLNDERAVQSAPSRLAWLFEPYVTDLYERRQWAEISRFEGHSTGAKLVAALILSTSRTGEFVTASEATQLQTFHAERRKWLAGYLAGGSCDPECRGKLVDLMLSLYGEAQGEFDEVLKSLLQRPRGDAGPALSRLHARLLWCQVDNDDLQKFRDAVLVPTVRALLAGKPDAQPLEDVLALLAMTPEPIDPVAKAAWKDVLAQLQKLAPTVYQRSYVGRRAYTERERKSPPPQVKKLNFCGAEDLSFGLPTANE